MIGSIAEMSFIILVPSWGCQNDDFSLFCRIYKNSKFGLFEWFLKYLDKTAIQSKDLVSLIWCIVCKYTHEIFILIKI